MKKCTECKEWKELSEFYKRSDRPIGLQSRCKKCANKGIAEYRKTERGQKVIHRINTSPKAQESMRRYDASEKGRKNKLDLDKLKNTRKVTGKAVASTETIIQKRLRLNLL